MNEPKIVFSHIDNINFFRTLIVFALDKLANNQESWRGSIFNKVDRAGGWMKKVAAQQVLFPRVK